MAEFESLPLEQVIAWVREEIAHQDAEYGPFDSSVAKTRLAVACLEDEARECREAWQEGKRRPDWYRLREEAWQLAAVALRLVRDVEVELVD